jgi:hypothetical protein
MECLDRVVEVAQRLVYALLLCGAGVSAVATEPF